MKRMKKVNNILVIIVVSFTVIFPAIVFSATARQINIGINKALIRFVRQVKGAKAYLDSAKGVLVIPEVKQAGFIVGGEYGEGGLRVGGQTVSYYNIVSGSIGPQIGAQQKDIILVFMKEGALNKFRASKNWQAGVDGTVTIIESGAEGSIDTTKINQPIVGFVSGQKGLMAGAMIEGSKFSRMKK